MENVPPIAPMNDETPTQIEGAVSETIRGQDSGSGSNQYGNGGYGNGYSDNSNQYNNYEVNVNQSYRASQAGYNQSTGQSQTNVSNAGYQQTQGQSNNVQQAQYQDYGNPPNTFGNPNFNNQNPSGLGLPRSGIGSPNETNPTFGLQPQTGPYVQPGANYFNDTEVADLVVDVQEAQSGRIMIGAAYNSDNGITGQLVIDERNFDILRPARSFEDFMNGTAWRGAGQSFRMELVPGNQVQRYLVSFSEPYLFDTPISFSTSGYFYDRAFFDWDEQRIGGQLSLGYRLTYDLSVNVGVRLENVDIHDPRVPTSPQLNGVLGDNELYVGHVNLVYDTRDHPFLATEGVYINTAFYEAFGDFDYARGDFEFRKYQLLYERPDGSGRHTVSFGTRLGFSGAQTPVFENYFAGGFSTMRGFDFRGASPVENGVRVGGEFQWLNSAEYIFPLTSDDMIKGVLFCDFGTVEESITIDSDNFRVAPGFGFRVHMPFGGAGGAPLAFDFAFPVARSDSDDVDNFAFYMGLVR